MRIPSGKRWHIAFVGCSLLAALDGGCAGGDATGPIRPADQTCPSAAVPMCEDTPETNLAREDVADLVGRVAPKLENPDASRSLVTGLGQLAIELGLGNVTNARRALSFSRDALTEAMSKVSAYPGDGPDLGAIELELDRVATLLGTS
jgi:hypothetical protein